MTKERIRQIRWLFRAGWFAGVGIMLTVGGFGLIWRIGALLFGMCSGAFLYGWLLHPEDSER